jgi:hypothetical protein
VLDSHLGPIFGNINDDWPGIKSKITDFSKLSDDLPEACSMCQGRFTEINSVAESIDNNGVFF